jgi:hypothetical protein
MHHMKLKAAVEKFTPIHSAGTTKEELKGLILADEKGYTEEEAEDILNQFKFEDAGDLPAVQPPPPPPPKKPAVVSEGPNASLQLDKFDYKNLKGAKFKEYVELVGDRSFTTIDVETGQEIPVVGQLKQNDMYDFQLFRMVPIMKDRFPGVKDTPRDFIGLTMKNDTPEHTTRITVAQATEYNAQILNAHSRAGHGKYYLLKK